MALLPLRQTNVLHLQTMFPGLGTRIITKPFANWILHFCSGCQ